MKGSLIGGYIENWKCVCIGEAESIQLVLNWIRLEGESMGGRLCTEFWNSGEDSGRGWLAGC